MQKYLGPGWALPELTPRTPLIWPQVQDLFEAEGNDRLKLLVLYSGEDDELLQRAAAGGLAMLTSMRPSLCSRIPQVVSASAQWEGEVGQEPPAWWRLVGEVPRCAGVSPVRV